MHASLARSLLRQPSTTVRKVDRKPCWLGGGRCSSCGLSDSSRLRRQLPHKMRKLSSCTRRPIFGQMLTGRIVITTCMMAVITAVPEKIPIGAIFPPGTDELQTALKYTFHIHNTNDSQARFKVEPIIDLVDSEDPFKIARTKYILYRQDSTNILHGSSKCKL
ncbi:uncharacterized protein NPIL_156541 [Nephila pilipes]|uniref:Uncharacterized protein n=1 Tax=Nephila pilipes TaxID=299642 RepID=A0A8X6T9C5_NEPPI|nr:uncharacterized protein NPIL_156541 [Nephila pilipes]